MTYLQFKAAQLKEIHSEYGTPYAELNSLYPDSYWQQEYDRMLENKARSKELRIYDLQWLEKNNHARFMQFLKFNNYLQQEYINNGYSTKKPRNK